MPAAEEGVPTWVLLAVVLAGGLLLALIRLASGMDSKSKKSASWSRDNVMLACCQVQGFMVAASLAADGWWVACRGHTTCPGEPGHAVGST